MLRTVASLCMAQGGNFVHLCTLSFVGEHSILARSVFVLRGHRLCRDIAVVLTSSVAIWPSPFSQELNPPLPPSRKKEEKN